MKIKQRYLVIVAIISGFFVFSVFFGFGYFSNWIGVFRDSAGISITSPLLPNGWKTYDGNLWSVGYPSTYIVVERASDVTTYFVPENNAEQRTYFLVQQELNTFTEIKIARSNTEMYPDPVDVMIANYSALKYSFGSGRVEYLINYKTTPFLLVLDDPSDVDSGRMLATFVFIE